MSKKILLLNQTFYPDHAATSQQLTDLAVELVKNGYSLDAIADIRSWDNRDVILPRYEVYQGVRIFRVGSSGFGKKTYFHRGLDYLTFNLSLIRAMFQLPRYDYIIGLTSPPWISFFGAVLGRYKHTPFIHWAMDINPDEAVELGWVSKGSWFYKILSNFADYTYANSDKIIVLDKYMAERIHAKSVNGSKVMILPPWSLDGDIGYTGHERNPFRKKHGLDGKFVVMYSGNFSVCHPLDTLLGTAKKLKDDKDIIFMFIGGGVRQKEIRDFKDKHYLDNIVVLPYQDRKDLKYSLSSADLHVVVMGEPYVGIIHPCKIYGILSTGRPFVLVGPKKSHVGDIIAEHKIGYQVDHGDVDGMLAIVNEVRSLSGEVRSAIRLKNINIASALYSRNILAKKFIDQCIKKIT